MANTIKNHGKHEPKQWASVPYSLRDEDSIKRVLEGTDVVVNMIGAWDVCVPLGY